MRLLRSVLFFLLFVGVANGHGKHEPHELKAQQVLVAEITSLFSEFDAQNVEHSFASLVVDLGGENLNLRFSTEDGVPGLDWELLAEKNIADEDVFLTFAESRGFNVMSKSANGIVYLRVESAEPERQADVASLCASLLIEKYGLKPSSKIDFYARNVKLNGTQF